MKFTLTLGHRFFFPVFIAVLMTIYSMDVTLAASETGPGDNSQKSILVTGASTGLATLCVGVGQGVLAGIGGW